MNYTKPERLSLKLHDELDEKWIQAALKAMGIEPTTRLCPERRRQHADVCVCRRERRRFAWLTIPAR